MPQRVLLATLTIVAFSAALSACSGDDSGDGGAATIELSPQNLLLVGAGDRWQLEAVVRDGEGRVIDVPVAWEVDDSSVVAVDGTGQVTSLTATGSSAFRAVIGELRSEDGFVFPAVLQPDTVVLSDAQVASGPEAVGDFTFSPGDRLTIEVTDVGTAAVGQPIVAREDASVLGRITTITGNSIEYELAPLTTVYRDLDVDVRRPLRPDPTPGMAVEALELSAGPLSCEAEIGSIVPDVTLIGDPAPTVTIDGGVVIERMQIAGGIPLTLEIALEGRATTNAVAEITLPDPLEASATCKISEDIPIPITGPFKDVLAPLVEVGIGFQLEGEVSGVRLGLRGTLVLDSGMIRTGLRYQDGMGLVPISPDLSMAVLDGTQVEVITPELSDVRVNASISLYEIWHLKAGSKFLIDHDIDAAQEYTVTRIGARHTIEATVDELAQLDDPAFATNYNTELLYQFGPGSFYDGYLWLVGLEADDVTLEISPEVARSPVGTLAFSPGVGVPDEPVTATVTLTSNETYLGVANVQSVHLFHEVGGVWVEMGPAEPGVTEATFTWTPTTADTGRHRFAAMVDTLLFPGLIEIDPNSVQTIDVGDFVGVGTLIFDPAGVPMQATDALDINDAGMVTGYGEIATGWVYWLYRPGSGVEIVTGGINYLSDSGAEIFPPMVDWLLPGDSMGTISAHSRNGVFAGTSGNFSRGYSLAYVYAGSSAEILSAYTPGVEMWRIQAVNDSGVVVGNAEIGTFGVPAYLSGTSPAPIGLPSPLDTGSVTHMTNGGFIAGLAYQLGVSGTNRVVVWSGGGPTVIEPDVLTSVVDIEDPDLILGQCAPSGCYRLGRLGGTFVDLSMRIDVITDTSGSVQTFDIDRYWGMNATGTLLATGRYGGLPDLFAIVVPMPTLP